LYHFPLYWSRIASIRRCVVLIPGLTGWAATGSGVAGRDSGRRHASTMNASAATVAKAAGLRERSIDVMGRNGARATDAVQGAALGFEPIARLPDGEDVLWLRWIVFELPPQLRDVDVHRARHDLDAVAPDFSQKLEP
jgi:hypothetical protein